MSIKIKRIKNTDDLTEEYMKLIEGIINNQTSYERETINTKNYCS